MDGRLRKNYQNAGNQAKPNQKRTIQLRKFTAQLIADGHKSNIDTGEKNDQSCISKCYTHSNSGKLAGRQFQEDHLTDQEKCNNQAQSQRYFLTGMAKGMQIGMENIITDRIIRHRVA